jgi:hypothetical protein
MHQGINEGFSFDAFNPISSLTFSPLLAREGLVGGTSSEKFFAVKNVRKKKKNCTNAVKVHTRCDYWSPNSFLVLEKLVEKLLCSRPVMEHIKVVIKEKQYCIFVEFQASTCAPKVSRGWVEVRMKWMSDILRESELNLSGPVQCCTN